MENYINTLFLTIALLLGVNQTYYSQNEPFNCVYDAYLFQGNDIYAINLASGTSILAKENIVASNINAAAYNTADGYLWGFLKDQPSSLIRIGNDFSYNIYTIPGLPEGGTYSYVGDISANGVYYYKAGKTTHSIDLNPNSPTYLTYLGSFDVADSISVHDWAFNINDNNLYTVAKGTNHLYCMNTSVQTMVDLGEVPILAGNDYTYGAVYFDLAGNLYVSANQTGTIYIVKEVQNVTPGAAINSNLFAFGPASAQNDGARCPSAPVPFEDCANGVDDDGDGLIDCDDPSCSGEAACPVVTITTSGNDGGLESNNRLSQKINKRNYFRSKAGDKFNPAKSPSFKRKSRTLNDTKLLGTNISDYIPVDAITTTNIVTSTPQDLIDLTNADQVVAVDYMNKTETVASVLALRTKYGVYEHTKYICDRLFGGELLSVSTMYLDEQPFIKSVVKNPGGEIEYVVSFAARCDDSAWTVESHWNLDKYPAADEYFNFQIWSNSIDDLYKLASSIIASLKEFKNIEAYNTSAAPSVYVRSGNYKAGELMLNVVKNTSEGQINMTGGYRTTETAETEFINASVEATGYVTSVAYETGMLFDVGLRLEDTEGGVPDDVFLSDGPWGLDDSAPGTAVKDYSIYSNDGPVNLDSYLVERNIEIKASVENYVSVYKAFSPRFRPVDLTGFNSVKLDSKGSGILQVVLMKESISNWEDQFKYEINLSEDLRTSEVSLANFKNSLGESVNVNDVTMMVFVMENHEGTTVEKELTLENVQFVHNESLNNSFIETTSSSSEKAFVNTSKVVFYSSKTAAYNFSIYNVSGGLVHSVTGDTELGENIITYSNSNLKQGVYYYTLSIDDENVFKGKLLFK
ncbi:hypothetical protein N9901_03110 [Flavobacteriaceae bacterium]|nr:hypothetical protein [Flavobacteriaceae bacterium]